MIRKQNPDKICGCVLLCGSASNWWERSPNSGNSTNFCNVNSDGSANNNNASNTRLLAPFGCFLTGKESSESEIKALEDTGGCTPRLIRGEFPLRPGCLRAVAIPYATMLHEAALIKFEDVSSFEALMEAADECRKSVMWKSSTQMFAINQMRWAQTLSKQLNDGTYKSRGFNSFMIFERGKTRHIQSVHITERCVQKSLCKNALKPILVPSLIYDNAASLPGKGTSFAVKRLKLHLWRHYQKHGREGGILLMDYSNYFGSIDHEKLLAMLREKIEDDRIFELTKHFVECFEGSCGLGLGSEISQICAIFYPNKIDHYIKERLLIKGYARYMDDSYIIHEDIEHLKFCLEEVKRLSEELGLKLNMKRTRIVPLDEHFEYLKKRIHITETGKVIMRPVRKSITKRRRLLKKQKKLLDAGRIDFETIRQSHQSWKGCINNTNSYRTVQNMDRLFNSLFLAEFISRKEKSMEPEMVKELKRQQEAHNKQMQEMDEFFLKREETIEENLLEEIAREVRGE